MFRSAEECRNENDYLKKASIELKSQEVLSSYVRRFAQPLQFTINTISKNVVNLGFGS